MQRVNFSRLKDEQIEINRQINIEEGISEEDIKYVAGFEVLFYGATCICAAVVLDYKTLQVVEKKYSVSKAVMNYVPGFSAFREGPPICQIYYDLEYEPELIIVNGHGIAHPVNAGLASFVGVELAKPVIGCAKSLLVGEEKDGDILFEGAPVGKVVNTKEHANPLYVSPGNLISIELASEIVKKSVIAPHKLPEALHLAHRFAKNVAKEQNSKPMQRVAVAEQEV